MQSEARKPFSFLRKLLILAGLIECPYGPWSNVLTVFALTTQFYIVFAALAVLFEDHTFSEKVEGFLCFSCNFHLTTKLLILPTRRSLLKELLQSLEEMDEESSKDPELRKESDKNIFLTKFVGYLINGGFTFMHFGAITVSIIKHLNNIDTMPFQFFVPFPKKEYFYLACVYVYGISAYPILNLSAVNALLCSLSVNASTQMLYLTKRLEMIGSNEFKENEDAFVNKCIHLHQQVLRVTEGVNNLFADLIYIEYLISSLQCCIAGYQILIAKGNHDQKIHIYMIVFLLTLFVPVLFSFCGNKIKLMSEQIFVGAQNNSWYTLSNSNKKKVLIIQTVSKKTLQINYRNLMSFDLEQYSLMLKTAYSLIAVLQTMDSPQ